MARGEAWLKAELVKALKWDEFVVDGVVDVICKAKSADEIEKVVNDVMENNPLAISIISDYMAAKTAPKQQRHQQSGGPAKAQPVVPPSPQDVPSSYSARVTAAPKPSPVKQAAAAKHDREKWLNLGGSQAPLAADEASQAGTRDSKQQSKEQAEETLAMFKRGGKVKPRSAASGSGSGSGSSSAGSSRKGQHQLDSITANLERKVANCLSCGKIYDCRNVTNDIIVFIHDGFNCTFCGSSVAMTQQQRIQQAQQQQQSEPASSSSSTTEDSATVQAIAFKDRLVDYDRNAQQRTTVIDNQSDYFEIDTNAWLSEEERAELRRREQLEAETAAARRNKVFVTLDLLGRKVLTAEGPGAAAGEGGGSSSSGAAFQIGSATDQLRQNLLAGGGSSSKSGGSAAAASGGAVSAVDVAGSDSNKGVESPTAQVALDQALASIRDLRITANTTMANPTPVFVPVRNRQQQRQQPVPALDQASSRGHGKQQQRPGKADAGQPHRNQQQQQQQHQQHQQQRDGDRNSRRSGGAAARAAAADGRIQDDSIFTEFEAELLYDDLVKQQRSVASSVKA